MEDYSLPSDMVNFTQFTKEERGEREPTEVRIRLLEMRRWAITLTSKPTEGLAHWSECSPSTNRAQGFDFRPVVVD